jgi:hypothetical protein
MLRTKIAAASIVTTILDQIVLTLASHVRTIMATAMTDMHHNFVCGLHVSSFLLSTFFDAFAIIFTSYNLIENILGISCFRCCGRINFKEKNKKLSSNK